MNTEAMNEIKHVLRMQLLPLQTKGTTWLHNNY